MRISFDFDGVLYDTHTPMIELVKRDTGFEADIRKCRKWDDLADTLRITKKQMFRYFWMIWKGMSQDALEKDAVEISKALYDQGHKIDVLTAKPSAKLEREVRGILDYNGFLYEKVVVTHKHEDKYMYKYDWYVDDHPDMARWGMKEGRNVAIYTQPWNEDIDFNWPVVRVYNMMDVGRWILVDT